jgi:GntP family gluconate:H+ symporter
MFYVLFILLVGIAVIVLLTAKFGMHAFFALLIACFIVGLSMGFPVTEVISQVKDGFGTIMKSLALIIVLGTTLGVILEHTGSTQKIASAILRKTGNRFPALAVSITGFVVGLPIFCDSGYIVLSGLNKPLSSRTGVPVTILSIAMATGLYSVHCLVPPHPGATGAASAIGVDFGKVIVMGMVVAIPAAIAGYLWAVFAGRRKGLDTEEKQEEAVIKETPSFIKSFLPIIVPILLIALRSFFSIYPLPTRVWTKIIDALGDPVLALSTGVLLAVLAKKSWKRKELMHLLQEGVEKGGSILMIIGAGGAFGSVLAASKIGDHLSQSLAISSMGIFFPFLLTSVLKTAQGSSTVAIITAASIIKPLLPALGLTGESSGILCVLSMGAGSMMISHANDAYFWVIARFSGMDMRTMLKVYSVATLLMGVTSILMVYLLSFVL